MYLDLELQFKVGIILGRAKEGIGAIFGGDTVDGSLMDAVNSPSIFLLPAIEVGSVEEGNPAISAWNGQPVWVFIANDGRFRGILTEAIRHDCERRAPQKGDC